MNEYAEMAIRAANERMRREYEASKNEPSIDAAWARCEAALPEGWWLEVSMSQTGWAFHASAGQWHWSPDYQWEDALGPTPAATLEALAARLEARNG